MLTHISLQNYRNLNIDIELQRINTIVASNGSGKSNFLEAVYSSALAKSFRPMESYSELVGPAGDFAKVTSQIDLDKLELIVTAQPKLQRRFVWNNKRASASSLIGNLPVILFAPHNVSLVNDDPAGRRSDLDDFLSIYSHEYSEALGSYRKIVKNRNALLKNIRDRGGDISQLNYWTAELVRLADILFSHRRDFFAHINPFLNDTTAKLYTKDHESFTAAYLINAITDEENYAEALAQKYLDNQQKEIVVGQTLYGPHKDDFELVFNGKNLRYLGSRGEQRLAVFAWKLAQHNYLFTNKQENPLLLIDDIMSELDESHRTQVSEVLLGDDRYHAIVTAAERRDMPDSIISGSQAITLQ